MTSDKRTDSFSLL